MKVGVIERNLRLATGHWNQKQFGIAFDEMEVGDSVYVELAAEAEMRRTEYNRVKSMRHYYQVYRTGRKYRIRSEGTDCRVFRLR